VRVAPEIEPSGPVLSGEERLTGTEFCLRLERGLSAAAAEVHSDVDTINGTASESPGRVDGVEERFGEADAVEEIVQLAHVGVVVGEVAVLVLNLCGEDGAAVVELERSDLLGEAADPALDGDHEGGVGAAECCGHARVFKEPGGKAAELPLGTAVGT